MRSSGRRAEESTEKMRTERKQGGQPNIVPKNTVHLQQHFFFTFIFNPPELLGPRPALDGVAAPLAAAAAAAAAAAEPPSACAWDGGRRENQPNTHTHTHTHTHTKKKYYVLTNSPSTAREAFCFSEKEKYLEWSVKGKSSYNSSFFFFGNDKAILPDSVPDKDPAVVASVECAAD